MSLIEDARRLAAQSVHEPYAGDHCVFCAGRRNVDDHLPHCPWLSMPRIVAALEAAQAVVDRAFFREDGTYEGRRIGYTDALEALVSALRGEVAHKEALTE